MDIILHLIQIIQQLYQQNCFLIKFICKYIPLKQWAYDDSHSPKYQKFKIDKLPVIHKSELFEPWNFPSIQPLQPEPRPKFHAVLLLQLLP